MYEYSFRVKSLHLRKYLLLKWDKYLRTLSEPHQNRMDVSVSHYNPSFYLALNSTIFMSLTGRASVVGNLIYDTISMIGSYPK